MKIATIFTIPLFWGIVSASPPFREINGKVGVVRNLDNQESQNKKIPDLETIVPGKGESDEDNSGNRLSKRSIFPFFKQDSIPFLEKNGEDEKDLGLLLNGFRIGKKIVDNALQALSKLVQNSNDHRKSLKSDELDKLTEIVPENEPHEVKKRENVKLLNVGGKDAEAHKKNINKSLRKAADDIENKKKAAAKKQEIFNSIPIITIHKEQKKTESDDKEKDNVSSVNKQKRSNSEELINVQRNKRGTSMSLWDTSDNDSEEGNDVVTNSHVSAVLKNRYASVAESLNSGLAIQKIIQQANVNAAKAQSENDDFEMDNLHNEFAKWLDYGLEYDMNDEQHTNQHLPSNPSLPKKQVKQIHSSAYTPAARPSANAQATASGYNVPISQPHNYDHSDLRWQYDTNPGYGNQHYPKKTQLIQQNGYFDVNNNDHEANLHDHSATSHILHESEHGADANTRNVLWENNAETKYGENNIYKWKNQHEYRRNGEDATATGMASSSAGAMTEGGAIQDGTFVPSTWAMKNKLGNNNGNDMSVAWNKAGTSMTNNDQFSKKRLGIHGTWNNADSSAISSASTSTINNPRNNAHGYQRFLSDEWLVTDDMENNDYDDVPNIEMILNKHTYKPSVLTSEHEIANVETVAKSKAKASAESIREKSWDTKDVTSDAEGNKYTATNTVIGTVSEEKHKLSQMFAKEMLATGKKEDEPISQIISTAKSETTTENKNKETAESDYVIPEPVSIATTTPSSSVKKLTTSPNEWLGKEMIASDVHKTRTNAVTTSASSTNAGITSDRKDRHELPILSVEEKTTSSKDDGILSDKTSASTIENASASESASAGASDSAGAGANANAGASANANARASVSASVSASAETSKQRYDKKPDKIVTMGKSDNRDEATKQALGPSPVSNSGSDTASREKHRLPQLSAKNKPLQEGIDIQHSTASVTRDESSVTTQWLDKDQIISNIQVTTPSDTSTISSTTFTESSIVHKNEQNLQNTKYEVISGKDNMSDWNNTKNAKDDNGLLSTVEQSVTDAAAQSGTSYDEGYRKKSTDGLEDKTAEIENAAKASESSSKHIDSVNRKSTTDTHKITKWNIGENEPKHNDNTVTISEKNYGKQRHNDVEATASTTASATANAATNVNSDDNHKKYQQTVNDVNANILVDKSTITREEGKEERSNPTTRDHTKLRDNHSVAAASASANANAGAPYYAANSNVIKQEGWMKMNKNEGNEENVIPVSEKDPNALAGATSSLNVRDDSDKSKTDSLEENKQNQTEYIADISTSVSANGDKSADHSSMNVVGQSELTLHGNSEKNEEVLPLNAIEDISAATESHSSPMVEGKNEKEKSILWDYKKLNSNEATAAAAASVTANSVMTNVVNNSDESKQAEWMNMHKSGANEEHVATASKEDNGAVAETATSSNVYNRGDNTQMNSSKENKQNEPKSIEEVSASASGDANKSVDHKRRDKFRKSEWTLKENNQNDEEVLVQNKVENTDAMAQSHSYSHYKRKEGENESIIWDYTKTDGNDATAAASKSVTANVQEKNHSVNSNDSNEEGWIDMSKNENNEKHVIPVWEDDTDAATGETASSNVQNDGDKVKVNSLKDDKQNLTKSIAVASAFASTNADETADDSSRDKDGQSEWILKENNVKNDEILISNAVKKADAAAEPHVISHSEETNHKTVSILRDNTQLSDTDANVAATTFVTTNADVINDKESDNDSQQKNHTNRGKEWHLIQASKEDSYIVIGKVPSSSVHDEGGTSKTNSLENNKQNGAESIAEAFSSADAEIDKSVDYDRQNKVGKGEWALEGNNEKKEGVFVLHEDENKGAAANMHATSMERDRKEKATFHLWDHTKSSTNDATTAAAASATANADVINNEDSTNDSHQDRWEKDHKNGDSDRHLTPNSKEDSYAVVEEVSSSNMQNENYISKTTSLENSKQNGADSIAVVSTSADAEIDKSINYDRQNKVGKGKLALEGKDEKKEGVFVLHEDETTGAAANMHATSMERDRNEKATFHLWDHTKSSTNNATAAAAASATADADVINNEDSTNDSHQDGWEKDHKNGDIDRHLTPNLKEDSYAVVEEVSSSNVHDEGGTSKTNSLENNKQNGAESIAEASSSADAEVNKSTDHDRQDEVGKGKLVEKGSNEKKEGILVQHQDENTGAAANLHATSMETDRKEKATFHLWDHTKSSTNDATTAAAASATANADVINNEDSNNDFVKKEWKKSDKFGDSGGHLILDSKEDSYAVVGEVSSSNVQDENDKSKINSLEGNKQTGADSIAEVSASAAATAFVTAHSDKSADHSSNKQNENKSTAEVTESTSASADKIADHDTRENVGHTEWLLKGNGEKIDEVLVRNDNEHVDVGEKTHGLSTEENRYEKEKSVLLRQTQLKGTDATVKVTKAATTNADVINDADRNNDYKQGVWKNGDKDRFSDGNLILASEEDLETVVGVAVSSNVQQESDKTQTTTLEDTKQNEAESIAEVSASATANASHDSKDKVERSKWILKESSEQNEEVLVPNKVKNTSVAAKLHSTSHNEEIKENESIISDHTLLSDNDATSITLTSATARGDMLNNEDNNKDSKYDGRMNSHGHGDNVGFVIPVSEKDSHALVGEVASSNMSDGSDEQKTNSLEDNKNNETESITEVTESTSANADKIADHDNRKMVGHSEWIPKGRSENNEKMSVVHAVEDTRTSAEINVLSTENSRNEEATSHLWSGAKFSRNDATAAAAASATVNADVISGEENNKDSKHEGWINEDIVGSVTPVTEKESHPVVDKGASSNVRYEDDKSQTNTLEDKKENNVESIAKVSAFTSANADNSADHDSKDKVRQSEWVATDSSKKNEEMLVQHAVEDTNAAAETHGSSIEKDGTEKGASHLWEDTKLSRNDANSAAAASTTASVDEPNNRNSNNDSKQEGWKKSHKNGRSDQHLIPGSEEDLHAVVEVSSSNVHDEGDKSKTNSAENSEQNNAESIAEASASAAAYADNPANHDNKDKVGHSEWILKASSGKNEELLVLPTDKNTGAAADMHATSMEEDRNEKATFDLWNHIKSSTNDATAAAASSAIHNADMKDDVNNSNQSKQEKLMKMHESVENGGHVVAIAEKDSHSVVGAVTSSNVDDEGDKSQMILMENSKESKAESIAEVSSSAAAETDESADHDRKHNVGKSKWTWKESNEENEGVQHVQHADENTSAAADMHATSMEKDRNEKATFHLWDHTKSSTDDATAAAAASATANADVINNKDSNNDSQEKRLAKGYKNKGGERHLIPDSEEDSHAVVEEVSSSNMQNENVKSKTNSLGDNKQNGSDSIAVVSTSAEAEIDKSVDYDRQNKVGKGKWALEGNNEKKEGVFVLHEDENTGAAANMHATSMESDRNEKATFHLWDHTKSSTNDATAAAAASATANADVINNEDSKNDSQQEGWRKMHRNGGSGRHVISDSQEVLHALVGEVPSSNVHDEAGKSKKNSAENSKQNNAESIAEASASADVYANDNEDKFGQSEWTLKATSGKNEELDVLHADKNTGVAADMHATSIEKDRNEKATWHLWENMKLSDKYATTAVSSSATSSGDVINDGDSDNNPKSASDSTNAEEHVDVPADDNIGEIRAKSIKIGHNQKTEELYIPKAIEVTGVATEMHNATHAEVEYDKTKCKVLKHTMSEDTHATAETTAFAKANAQATNRGENSNDSKEEEWIKPGKNEDNEGHVIRDSSEKSDAVAGVDVSPNVQNESDELKMSSLNNNKDNDANAIAVTSTSESANADEKANTNRKDNVRRSEWNLTGDNEKNDKVPILNTVEDIDVAEESLTILHDQGKSVKTEPFIWDHTYTGGNDSTATDSRSVAANVETTINGRNSNEFKEKRWMQTGKIGDDERHVIPVWEDNSIAAIDAAVASTVKADGDILKANLLNVGQNDATSIAVGSATASTNTDETADLSSRDKVGQSEWILKGNSARNDEVPTSNAIEKTNASAESYVSSNAEGKNEKTESILWDYMKSNSSDATAVASAFATANTEATNDGENSNEFKQERWIKMDEVRDKERRVTPASEEDSGIVAEIVATSNAQEKGDKLNTISLDRTKLSDVESITVASALANTNADEVNDGYSTDKVMQVEWITVGNHKKDDELVVPNAYENAGAAAEAHGPSHAEGNNEKTKSILLDHTQLGITDATATSSAAATATAEMTSNGKNTNASKQNEWMTTDKIAGNEEHMMPVSEQDLHVLEQAVASSNVFDRSDKPKTNSLEDNKQNENKSTEEVTASTSANDNKIADRDSGEKDRQSEWIPKESSEKNEEVLVVNAVNDATTASGTHVSTIQKDSKEKATSDLWDNTKLSANEATTVAATSVTANVDAVNVEASNQDSQQQEWKRIGKNGGSEGHLIPHSKEDSHTVGEVLLLNVHDESNKSKTSSLEDNKQNDVESIAKVSSSAAATANKFADHESKDKVEQNEWVVKDSNEKNEEMLVLHAVENAGGTTETHGSSIEKGGTEKAASHLWEDTKLSHKDTTAAVALSARANAHVINGQDNIQDSKQAEWIELHKSNANEGRVVPVSEKNSHVVIGELESTNVEDESDKSKTNSLKHNKKNDVEAIAEASASASANANKIGDHDSEEKVEQSEWIPKEGSGTNEEVLVLNTISDAVAASGTHVSTIEKERNEKGIPDLWDNTKLSDNDASTVAATSATANVGVINVEANNKDSQQQEWKSSGKNGGSEGHPITDSKEDLHALVGEESTSNVQDEGDKSKTKSTENNKQNNAESIAEASASAFAYADKSADHNNKDKDGQSEWILKARNGQNDQMLVLHAEKNTDAVAETHGSSIEKDGTKKIASDLWEDPKLSLNDATVAPASSAIANADVINDQDIKSDSEQEEWKMGDKNGVREGHPIPDSKEDSHAVVGEVSSSDMQNENDKPKTNSLENNKHNVAESIAEFSSSADAEIDKFADHDRQDKVREGKWTLKGSNEEKDEVVLLHEDENTRASVDMHATSMEKDINKKTTFDLRDHTKLGTNDATAAAAGSATANADVINNENSTKDSHQEGWEKDHQYGDNEGHLIPDSKEDSLAVVGEVSSSNMPDENDKSKINSSEDNKQSEAEYIVEVSASATENVDKSANNKSADKARRNKWVLKDMSEKNEEMHVPHAVEGTGVATDMHATSMKKDRNEKATLDLWDHTKSINNDATAAAAASATANADVINNEDSNNDSEQKEWKKSDKIGDSGGHLIPDSKEDFYAVVGEVSLSNVQDENDKSKTNSLEDNKQNGADSIAEVSASADAEVDKSADHDRQDKVREGKWSLKGSNEEKDEVVLLHADENTRAAVDMHATSMEKDRNEKTAFDLRDHTKLSTNDATAAAATSAIDNADMKNDAKNSNQSKQEELMKKHKSGATGGHVVAISEKYLHTVVGAVTSSNVNDDGDKSKTTALEVNKQNEAEFTAKAFASAAANDNKIIDHESGEKVGQSEWMVKDSNEKTEEMLVPHTVEEASATAESQDSFIENNRNKKAPSHIWQDKKLSANDATTAAATSTTAHIDVINNDSLQKGWKKDHKNGGSKRHMIPDSEDDSYAGVEQVSSPDVHNESDKSASAAATSNKFADHDSKNKVELSEWVVKGTSEKNEEMHVPRAAEDTAATAETHDSFIEKDRNEKAISDLWDNTRLSGNDATAAAAASATGNVDVINNEDGKNDSQQEGWRKMHRNGGSGRHVISDSQEVLHALVGEVSSSNVHDEAGKSKKNSAEISKQNNAESIAEVSALTSTNADNSAHHDSKDKVEQNKWVIEDSSEKNEEMLVLDAVEDTGVAAETHGSSIEKDGTKKGASYLWEDTKLSRNDANSAASASATANVDEPNNGNSNNDFKQEEWKKYHKNGSTDRHLIPGSEKDSYAVVEEVSSSNVHDEDDKSKTNSLEHDKQNEAKSFAKVSASATAASNKFADHGSKDKVVQSEWVAKGTGEKNEEMLVTHSVENTDAVAETHGSSIEKYGIEKAALHSWENRKFSANDATAAAASSARANADVISNEGSNNVSQQEGWKMSDKNGGNEGHLIPDSEEDSHAVVGDISSSNVHDESDKSKTNSFGDNKQSEAEASASANTNANKLYDDSSRDRAGETEWTTIQKNDKNQNHMTQVSEKETDNFAEADIVSHVQDKVKKAESIAVEKHEKNHEHFILNVGHKTTLDDSEATALAGSTVSANGGYKLAGIRDGNSKLALPSIIERATEDNENSDSVSQSNAETCVEAGAVSHVEVYNENPKKGMDSTSDTIAISTGSAEAKSVPVSVYQYIRSKEEISDDDVGEDKHAQSDSTGTNSAFINKDKMMYENIDYKVNNLISNEATASPQATLLSEGEADIVSTSENMEKQVDYLQNINAATKFIADDGDSSKIKSISPVISSWKEKERLSTKQNSDTGSFAYTEASNKVMISNDDKEDGWFIKWNLNDHSLPLTAINKAGAREVSQSVGPIIPSTTISNSMVEKKSNKNTETSEEADLIVMRKQYGNHKPMSITYIRNSIPPMVVYRVIPKSVYEQVRELISQGDTVHVSYATPQISKA